MTLGLPTTSSSAAEFLPYVKYDAKAGRMFRIDREQNSYGEWETKQVELITPTFAIDFGGIRVGWMNLGTGGAPDFQNLVPLGQAIPRKPSDDHQSGFQVKILGKALNGLRVFSSSAKCVVASMDALHNKFEDAPEAKEGKIPVVQMTSATPITTQGPRGKQTNYQPDWEITQWIDRPAEFGERTVPPPGGTAKQAEKPSNHVGPPASKAKNQKIEEDEIPW